MYKYKFFPILGSYLRGDDGISSHMRTRVNAAWMLQRDVTGVLRDRKMPVLLNPKSIIRQEEDQCLYTPKQDFLSLKIHMAPRVNWQTKQAKMFPSRSVRHTLLHPISQSQKFTVSHLVFLKSYLYLCLLLIINFVTTVIFIVII